MALSTRNKIIIGGVAVPTVAAVGFGLFVLYRIFKARGVEGGAGEAGNKKEEPVKVDLTLPPEKRCQNIHLLLGTPTGCGTVKVLGYNRGVQTPVTIRELPGRPGFYLQTSPIDAYGAFLRLEAASKAAGIPIEVNSAFRTQGKQEELYTKYIRGTGNLAAKPGFSNHQYGTTLDLQVKSNPALFTWLTKNGAKYGFFKTVKSENWHWEYKVDQDPAQRGVV